MEDLRLSDTLQRYFSDIFLCCDEEKSGKASLQRTIELIKSGNIPDDVLSQISDLCWNHSTSNYLNRKQFYSALKLVAAHQASLPLTSDVLTTQLELPMPRFSWIDADCGQRSPVPDLIELSKANDLNEYREHVDVTSTDSEGDSENVSTLRNGSPETSSTASDSPTPTNSVQDRNWAVSGAWRGLVSEEQRQLLGTEEESSDRHSSEEDTEVSTEVWSITPEQREYYTNQFRSLQPDVNALLAGTIARVFFEKSHLPVHELRKIWQLADVTKDGALSLQEFNTAMHLVVLRRNHIKLPEVLPPQLIPGNETPLSVSPETEPILSPQTKDTAKEWTKFVDSPTSSVSSPGPKPVNFDFQKVTLDSDPKILHPVALRLTPECGVQSEEVTDIPEGCSPKRGSTDAGRTEVNNAQNAQNSAIQRPQPKKINVPGPGAIPPPPTQQQQPPQPPDEGPVSLPAFPPPKKEKPPPPPPRPFKTHGRSSSLDLNRLTRLGAPPSVPPRVSPQRRLVGQRSEGEKGFVADFEQFENVTEGIFPGDYHEAERRKLFAQFSAPEGGEGEGEEVPRRHGAFEVYRKPTKGSPLTSEELAKWELFQRLQEQNTVLLRMCQELSQELADVKEEKIALKVKLEKQMSGG